MKSQYKIVYDNIKLLFDMSFSAERSNKRRLFLYDGNKYFKILSFKQNKNDGSIYVSSPGFSNLRWLHYSKGVSNPLVKITASPDDGYISFHSSGMTKITPNVHELVIHGNYLLSSSKLFAGVRHLFTTQLAKPKYLPPSPAFNRKSDVVIETKKLAPIVVLFFAVPLGGISTVNLQVDFKINNLESFPPEGGAGSMNLYYHGIVYYAYRTKFMEEWPKKPCICYHNGYDIPVFFGTDEQNFRMEMIAPEFKLSDDNLTVNIDATQQGFPAIYES